MALSFGRRKLRGETGGHGCRCRHFHVHYHLPRKRVCTFSLLRWLPRFSLLSCVLIPLVLFFVVLAFVVSFVWFTLLYFVAYLWNKDSDHVSFKSGSFGRASGDVDNHLAEDGWQGGKREAKGKAVKHAAELLAGDSATSVAGAKRLAVKEVHVDGLSEVSPNILRIVSSGASLSCEVPTNNDKFVKIFITFETATEVEPDDDLEGFSGRHEVEPDDCFVDEHNIRLVSGSESGDSSPHVYSLNSAQIHDLPDMNEVIEMSSDFLVGTNQNMVVPSNTSPHHYISDTNAEYGEDHFEDRKELSDCTPYGIIDFIDKHETTDQPLDSSFAKDEIVGLLASSAGSAHGRIPDEHSKESTEEEDAESVLEFLVDSVATLDDFDEQRVPEIPITEAGTEQSVAASNEMHGFSNENETSELSLCSVCDDTVFSDAPSPHDNDCADDRQQEATENNIGAISDPASVACDFVENHQTATRALDDSANVGSTQEVVSRESSEGEADKVNDNSSTEGARPSHEPAFYPRVVRKPARPVRSALTRLARPPLPLAPLPSPPPPPPAPNPVAPSSSTIPCSASSSNPPAHPPPIFFQWQPATSPGSSSSRAGTASSSWAGGNRVSSDGGDGWGGRESAGGREAHGGGRAHGDGGREMEGGDRRRGAALEGRRPEVEGGGRRSGGRRWRAAAGAPSRFPLHHHRCPSPSSSIFPYLVSYHGTSSCLLAPAQIVHRRRNTPRLHHRRRLPDRSSSSLPPHRCWRSGSKFNPPCSCTSPPPVTSSSPSAPHHERGDGWRMKQRLRIQYPPSLVPFVCACRFFLSMPTMCSMKIQPALNGIASEASVCLTCPEATGQNVQKIKDASSGEELDCFIIEMLKIYCAYSISITFQLPTILLDSFLTSKYRFRIFYHCSLSSMVPPNLATFAPLAGDDILVVNLFTFMQVYCSPAHVSILINPGLSYLKLSDKYFSIVPFSGSASTPTALVCSLLRRKSIDKYWPSREHSLTDWVRPKLSYKRWLLQIINPKLEAQYSVRGAHKACSLAYWCLSQNPKARLLMSDVVEMLEPLQEDGGSDGVVVHVGGLPDYRICRMLTGNNVHCRSIPSPKCPPVIPTCRVR
ncbi:hypothetical protein QYE76_010653 [Lolium multiflorum]|uniref:Uncharacterized protein n=1 Tax=Lolium multiflorum TaxID=4521 RepID=A0AAD8TVG5_LOLMU|nr:hypothetical protein QYE76_010653 [Lolium multiflorum]